MQDPLAPTPDPAWRLVEPAYDQLRESSRESRFAISNGFLGVRGTRAVNRGAHWVVPPRTYIAGLFDKLGTEQPIARLVPAPDWLQLGLASGGERLRHHANDGTCHRRTLDLRRGLLLIDCGLSRPGEVAVGLRTLTLVSLDDRRIGLQVVELTVESGTAELTLDASFAGIRPDLAVERFEHDLAVWRTNSSGKRLALAAAAGLSCDGEELVPDMPGPFRWAWTWQAAPGQSLTFHRIVAFARADGLAIDPAGLARADLAAARQVGWREVIAKHTHAWAARWHHSDIRLAGDADSQRALRFAITHLISAANPTDPHVSIAARALTGDDYLGHVFWDTEIYLLPFYIFTWPEAARSLLLYRWHTLPAARAKAAAMGWRGALYAWESADTGEETTPEQVIGPDRQVIDVLCGRQEQHISADVAYAVWHYWQVTGDDAFLCDAGAEIILETGRFWASRAVREADGQCHIRGVIGPDEYHETIDDNAFTNLMARWNIRRAGEIAAIMAARWPDRWGPLSDRLGITAAELADWAATAEAIAAGRDATTGLTEQFAGYFGLEDIDIAAYAGRSVPMDVVLGRARTKASQVIKQADVVALLGLLPDEFSPEDTAANWSYYAPRCGHGSSLSHAMHALVAARLGHTGTALDHFKAAAAIDLTDSKVSIDGGLHIAALGGLWQAAVFGFAGVALRPDGLAISPNLPPDWTKLTVRLQWRGRHLALAIGRARISATLESGAGMVLHVAGAAHRLTPGAPVDISLEVRA